jgi:lipopolysaccharide biosynthesis protein
MSKKIAIALYLYHTDLWPEFESLFLKFSNNINLYLALNVKDQTNTNLLDKITSKFSPIISYHNNFGADVAPFIQQVCNIDERYFIKIHSKKSTLGNNNQINWRAVLLYSFLGSPDIFNSNFNVIQQSSIGCVGNKNLLLNKSENTNSKKIKKLCDILNINYNNIPNRSFFAGNMFMGRTNLYKKYLDPNKEVLLNLLSAEKEKIDDRKRGTFTHSLERLFGYIVSYSNLNFGLVDLPYIKIQNSLAPGGYFHMITLYNNDCFLSEDINLYGHILDHKPERSIQIKWLHIKPNIIQNYIYLDSKTIIKNE